MDTSYAGTNTTYELDLARPLEPGDYFATLALADRKAKVRVASGRLPFTVEAPSSGSTVGGAGAVLTDIGGAVARGDLPPLWLPLLLVILVVLIGAVAAAAVLVFGGRRRRPA